MVTDKEKAHFRDIVDFYVLRPIVAMAEEGGCAVGLVCLLDKLLRRVPLTKGEEDRRLFVGVRFKALEESLKGSPAYVGLRSKINKLCYVNMTSDCFREILRESFEKALARVSEIFREEIIVKRCCLDLLKGDVFRGAFFDHLGYRGYCFVSQKEIRKVNDLVGEVEGVFKYLVGKGELYQCEDNEICGYVVRRGRISEEFEGRVAAIVREEFPKEYGV